MRLLLALSLLALPAFAEAPTLAPPPAGHFVVDTTGTLRPATRDGLDAIGAAINASDFGQLGVVVVHTTSGAVPREFATALFNHWGIGNAGRDDGVLLFLALDDRKAEVVVGSSTPLPQAVTDRIMRDDIIVNMKRKDPDAALLSAARSVQQALAAASPSVVVPSHAPAAQDVDEALAAYVRKEKAFADHTPRQWVFDLAGTLSASERAQLEVLAAGLYGEGKGRLVFLHVRSSGSWPSLAQLVDALEAQLRAGTPLAIVALDSAHDAATIEVPPEFLPSAWERQLVNDVRAQMQGPGLVSERLLLGGAIADRALRRELPLRPLGEVVSDGVERLGASLWAGLAALVVGLITWLRRWNRNRPRVCDTCSQPRERLSDALEDAHLSSGQQKEESVGSVDYDVWRCNRCDDTLVLRYGAFFSSYGTCSSCNFKTAQSSSRTLRHATEYSGGLVEVTERCSHCAHVHTYQRTTARITRSSSSSSSSSSRSSSSSSYGGGRSSGGGSSGSW
jgi:uncharacterized protein